MAELEIETGCRGTEVGVSKNNEANDISIIKSSFIEDFPDGTHVEVTVYVSGFNVVPAVGDLVDWNSQYRVTIEKI